MIQEVRWCLSTYQNSGPLLKSLNSDQWVPCSGERNVADWVQVGECGHARGISHNFSFGHPGWSLNNDNPYYRNYIVFIIGDPHKKEVAGMVLEFLGETGGLTWDECRDYAKSKGGKLPTKKELIEWMKGIPLTPKEDQWVAVAEKTWIQIGNTCHRTGEDYTNTILPGYPDWSSIHEYRDYRRYIVYHL